MQPLEGKIALPCYGWYAPLKRERGKGMPSRISGAGGGDKLNLREYAQLQKDSATGQIKEKAAPAERSRDAPAHPSQLPAVYRAVYREVFNFHARHTPAPQDAEEWQEVVQDYLQTAAAMGNTPFANALLTAVYEEMERTVPTQNQHRK